MAEGLAQRIAEIADLVTVALDELLPRAEGPESRLTEAMRYAALAPGKRLRPFFLIETGRMFDLKERSLLRAACALECVHAYSLVHDDLPAMDDDDLRRGRPTTTSPTTRRPPSWPAMRCRPPPSRSWPIRTPMRTAPCAPSWSGAWRWRRARGAWPEAR